MSNRKFAKRAQMYGMTVEEYAAYRMAIRQHLARRMSKGNN